MPPPRTPRVASSPLWTHASRQGGVGGSGVTDRLDGTGPAVWSFPAPAPRDGAQASALDEDAALRAAERPAGSGRDRARRQRDATTAAHGAARALRERHADALRDAGRD